MVLVGTGGGASVVGTAVGVCEGDSDGDGEGDADDDSVRVVSGRSAGVATTSTFDLVGAGDFDGCGPTIAPNAVSPPQHTTNVEVIPNATTATICWRFDIRAHSSAAPTMYLSLPQKNRTLILAPGCLE